MAKTQIALLAYPPYGHLSKRFLFLALSLANIHIRLFFSLSLVPAISNIRGNKVSFADRRQVVADLILLVTGYIRTIYIA